MTEFAPAVVMADDEGTGGGSTPPTSSWTPLDDDEYLPIEETRRTANVRSPLSREYDLPTVMDEVLGRESATCEACQKTVRHASGGDLVDGEPFVIRELVPNVYTVENRVLLCETCANRPADDWRADVRAKRARERDATPTWADQLVHWVTDPTATSLFARRVALTSAGLVMLVGTLTTVAGITGSLLGDLTTGRAWAHTVVVTAGAIASAFVVAPWIVGVLIGVMYAAHAVERVRYDPRGYRFRDYLPWMRLAAAGLVTGGGVLGLVGMSTGILIRTSLAQLLIATSWASGALGVAWYIDLAIRYDLAMGIWTPARGPWLIAGRVGLLPGLLALTAGVPFPGVIPTTTTSVLAAIPAGVALAFVGRRLPYDAQARDAILDALPEWLLRRLTENQRRN